LLIYRAQREHKTNMHIQIISIIALEVLLFDTKKFFGQDRIRIRQFFCSNSIPKNIHRLVHMRNCELNRDQNLIGGQMAVQN